ncbi:MAG: AraC family transcriptional regulator [Solitalea sp.]
MQNYHKYVSVSEEDEDWGLYLVTAGQARTDKGSRYPGGDHPREYLFNWNRGRILNGLYIVYVASGKGIFESANTPATTIGEGTCFLLLPNVWHRYRPDPHYGWREYWIGLRGSILQDWIEKQCIPADKTLYHTGVNHELTSLFKNILDCIQHNPPGLQPLVTGMALQLLGIVLGTEKKQLPQTIEQKIEWAKSFINDHLEQDIRGPQLAKELAISYSLFRKQFKNLTGKSPAQYHLDKRMEKAGEFLSTTRLSIKEIASIMGFDSIYYFSRVFRSRSGLSPTAYRKKHFLH